MGIARIVDPPSTIDLASLEVGASLSELSEISPLKLRITITFTHKPKNKC